MAVLLGFKGIQSNGGSLSPGLTSVGRLGWQNPPSFAGFPGGCRLSGDMIRHWFYVGTGPTTATLSVIFTIRIGNRLWPLLLT